MVHIFSHIHQTYIVFSVRVSDCSDREQKQKTCWLTKSALQEAAVSTGVKKVECVFIGVFTEKVKQTSVDHYGKFDAKNAKMYYLLYLMTDYEAL